MMIVITGWWLLGLFCFSMLLPVATFRHTVLQGRCRSSSQKLIDCRHHDRRGAMTMKWSFQTIDGSPVEKHGVVGTDGELLFHPYVRASINLPTTVPEVIYPQQTMPVVTVNTVLFPGCKDWFVSKSMKHRILMSETPIGGDIAFIPYLPTQNRLTLVGVVAKVESKEMTSDGSCKCVINPYSRCFPVKFTRAEDPYLIATIQRFDDYSIHGDIMKCNKIENIILEKLMVNIKLLRILKEDKSILFNNNVLKYRPPIAPNRTVRTVSPILPAVDMRRRTAFSFAVIDTLDISEVSKLKLLQNHIIDDRLESILEILENAQDYLKEELVKQGLSSVMQIEKIIRDGYQPDTDSDLY